jgi:O-acetylhomoserine (thiol)-lyase
MSEGIPGFSTLAIHAGAQPDPATGARATPIYQTTSFVFDDVDHAASLFGLQAFGNIYTRITNPTTAVLEERVSALEGGTAALATASGHSAQLLAFHTLMQPGDNIVAANKLYGGSINQLNHSFKSFGWDVKWADPYDLSTFEAAIDANTKAIFIESLANPGGIVVDIEAISQIAKAKRIPLIVDNTMATPYLCRPIEHGADIVLHSLTKFMGGHGNSMGGVIVDGGTFDWSADDRFPLLSKPRPEYQGVVLHETFGNFAFAIACRVLGLRDLGPAISPFKRFHDPDRNRDPAAAHAAPFGQRQEGRAAPVGAPEGHLGVLRGPAGRQTPRPAEEVHAQGCRCGVHLRRRRRLRRRRQVGVECRAVLSSRQYR